MKLKQIFLFFNAAVRTATEHCLQFRHTFFTRKNQLRTITIVLRNICFVHHFSSSIPNRPAPKSLLFSIQEWKNVSVCQDGYCHAISILTWYVKAEMRLLSIWVLSRNTRFDKALPDLRHNSTTLIEKLRVFFSVAAPPRKGAPLKPLTLFWKKMKKLPSEIRGQNNFIIKKRAAFMTDTHIEVLPRSVSNRFGALY